jgi:hypothetical protein
MTAKNQQPLQVSLHGMDGRAHKTMLMFLQGPCKGSAVVVDVQDSAVEIVDADLISSNKILKQRLAVAASKPVIMLSLQKTPAKNIIFVQKPVQRQAMLAAFQEARYRLTNNTKQSLHNTTHKQKEAAPAKRKKLVRNPVEQQKTAKHQTAMLLNEKSFSAFIGLVPNINFSDPQQWHAASYNPKNYLQGYVQSALQIALNRKQSLKLDSGWKDLLLLPQSREVWLDADEKQLRAFAGLPIAKGPAAITHTRMKMSIVNLKTHDFSGQLHNLHDMHTFVWKLACWTSKGRFPQGIDLHLPVYLKHWPNFTRLLITPHAMRICALLIQTPHTLPEVVQILAIKPQYVFVFASAAHALGILGQKKRTADGIDVTTSPDKQVKMTKGLMGKILSKLRGVTVDGIAHESA